MADNKIAAIPDGEPVRVWRLTDKDGNRSTVEGTIEKIGPDVIRLRVDGPQRNFDRAWLAPADAEYVEELYSRFAPRGNPIVDDFPTLRNVISPERLYLLEKSVANLHRKLDDVIELLSRKR